MKHGFDPLKVVVERAHEKGIQLLCSVRINEPSSPDGENLYMVGKLKFERPEVMIGGDDPHAACAYDFAHPEVRRERLAVIEEVCDRYGADGLEIDDYIRVFFKPHEVEKNTPVLTDFVREVRDLLDRISRKRGHRMCLAARVHPIEAANLAVGMDVRTWVSERLIDVVVPSSGGPETGFVDCSPYAEWLIDAAHQADASVYFRPGAAPYDDRHHSVTVEMYRAMYSVYGQAGADGLYLENLPWPHTERKYLVLREMGDPDIFARKAKHYLLGPRGPNHGVHSLSRHLPAILEEGKPVTVPVHVGEDLDSARIDGELEGVTLAVRIVQTGPHDIISFRFNGEQLSSDQAKVTSYYGGLVSYSASRGGLPARIDTHYWFEFGLPPGLTRQGENELLVTMDCLLSARVEQRILHSVELRTAYREPPFPVGGQM